MSESETKGRCRREFESYYADKQVIPNRSEWILADAIDRIAADVAAVKEATLPQTTEERDCAIRERDEARAEVERLKAELAEAKAETQRIQDEADDREETERVKRLNAEIEKTHRTLLNRTWERDEAKADAERLYAELAARPAATGWLTEGERQILAAHARSLREQRASLLRAGTHGYSASPLSLKHDADAIDALLARAGSPPVANFPEISDGSKPTAAGWLTDRERHVLSSMLSERPCDWSLHWADDVEPVFRSILDRAGSPPVVEVPVMVFGSGSYEMQKRYRAALDAAGVPWKEAKRE